MNSQAPRPMVLENQGTAPVTEVVEIRTATVTVMVENASWQSPVGCVMRLTQLGGERSGLLQPRTPDVLQVPSSFSMQTLGGCIVVAGIAAMQIAIKTVFEVFSPGIFQLETHIRQ